MKAALIITGSIFITTTVMVNAFYQKKQFYPSVVFITKSNPSLAAIYLQFLVIFLLAGKLMRRIFFGTLRAAELEHLIERSWYAVTETCLAFTVFKDDLTPKFVGVFAVLLFLKCFHWLAEDRVDYMERTPSINFLFHIRIVSLLSVLAFCDVLFIFNAYQATIVRGMGTHLVFGFEYAILLATILNILVKYTLHWIDLLSENPWDEKAVCLLYTELVMSVIRVSLYLMFVATMLKYSNFPLFALRPIYLSLRTLKKALSDVIMSRRAIRNMNTLYPNATDVDLANSDNVCIICREEMAGNGLSKKLPCNHIFHVACLRSWFQRQQTCPTCRMDILRAPQQGTTDANQQQQQQQQQNQQQQNDHGQPAGNSSGPGHSGQSSQGSASNSSGQNNTNTDNLSPEQVRIIFQDEVTAVMMQSFAQLFIQAMYTQLQVLNQQQQQQRQQQQHQNKHQQELNQEQQRLNELQQQQNERQQQNNLQQQLLNDLQRQQNEKQLSPQQQQQQQQSQQPLQPSQPQSSQQPQQSQQTIESQQSHQPQELQQQQPLQSEQSQEQ